MKKVAIVILNWNGSAWMRRFLPSVVENSAEASVVVADNGSTDESLRMLSDEFPTVRVIELDRNYGFAEGYNRAIEQIEEPLTLLLNNDVETPAGWLRPLLAFMESHSEVAAVQPKLIKEEGRDAFEYSGAAGGFIDRLGYPYCRGRLFDTVELDRGQYNEPMPIVWASGAALLVRTHVYKEVGGLDARFFAHQEEIDLCWRLRARGYGIWCIPQSTVYHVGGATLPKGNSRKTYLNFRNNLLMLYKNLPTAELWRVMAWRYVLDRLAALRMLMQGNSGEALAVMRARNDYAHTRHEFDEQRRQNLAATKVEPRQLLAPGSILWQYYVKGRKTYSALKQ